VKLRLSNGELFDYNSPEYFFTDGTYWEIPGSEFHFSFPDGLGDMKKTPWSEAPTHVVYDYERKMGGEYAARRKAATTDSRYEWVRYTGDGTPTIDY